MNLSKRNLNKMKEFLTKHKITILLITLFITLLIVFLTIIFNRKKYNDNNVKSMCTIKFDSMGGTLIENKTIECGNKIDPPTSPEKEGFEFITWYNIGEVFDFNTIINDDIILIADWKIKEGVKTIKVSFNTNGGTLIPSFEIATGTLIIKPNNPTKYGYKFIKWDYNGKEFDFTSPVSENIILNAIWEKQPEIPTTKNSNQNINDNTKNESSNSNQENNNNNDNNCSTTSSGAKSCIPQNLKWEAIIGKWYLTGTDDVIITFYNDSSNCGYQGTNFEFTPSKVKYDSSQGGGYPKSFIDSPYIIAMNANVTEITSSSITIDNKYKFYRQKNYPTHIVSQLEKYFNSLEGTWYLDGYYKDVYVKFTAGTHNNEKVLFYYEHDFCAESGLVNFNSCGGTSYFSYYSLSNSFTGIERYGWKYDSGVLYNTSSGKKLKFTKTPTSTPVSNITLDKTNLNLYISQTEKLVTTISPNNATNKNVYWSSNNEDVATVNQKGEVTARGVGTAIIRVVTNDGNKEAFCTVTVYKKVFNVSEVKLDKTEATLFKGSSIQLNAIISPSNADNQKVTWKSSDESIATVNKYGLVNALNTGEVTITVTTEDGNKQASCTINIENPPFEASGSIAVSYKTTNQGITRGISAKINAKGGTGNYTYYFIKLYRDDILVASITNTLENEIYFIGEINGNYKMEYEVRDSSGAIRKGTSSSIISGF